MSSNKIQTIGHVEIGGVEYIPHYASQAAIVSLTQYEREECAKIVENLASEADAIMTYRVGASLLRHAAALIRARTVKQD